MCVCVCVLFFRLATKPKLASLTTGSSAVTPQILFIYSAFKIQENYNSFVLSIIMFSFIVNVTNLDEERLSCVKK